LQKYSLSETEYHIWRQQIDDCVEGPPHVHFVRLNNQSRFSDDVILELINIEPGKALNLDQLDYDLRQIYGLGFIRQARYSVIENDGLQGIEITVLQDERGTDFIETGLDLAFGNRGTTFNIRGAYLKTDLDERGAEFRAMLQIGESKGVFVDYFKPLDDRLRYSFHPSAFYATRPLYIFDSEGDAVAEIELDEFGGSLSLTREFSRYARATAGFTRYSGSMDITVGNPDFRPFKFDGGELYIELGYDRLDNRYLPTRGLYSQLKYINSVKNLGADVDFDQLEFSIFSSHTFGRHNFIWGGQYYTGLDDHVPIYGWYSGGGFLNMSGYEANSLVGPNFGMVLAGYRFQVAQSGFLPGYVGTSLEYGNVSLDRSDLLSNGLINGSFYFAYKTPLGPVYLGLGWSEDRSAVYFLRFGSVFGARSFGRR
jgi:NTE family protein